MTSVKLDADQLIRDLERIGRALEDPDVSRAGEQLAEDARGRAPRLTGRLASEIVHVARADGFEVVSPTRYAPYVHARQPFLTEALRAGEATVTDAYARAVDRAMA